MKKLFFVFMVSLFFLQFVSAIDTEIKVVAPSNYGLRLEFINPNAVEDKEEASMEIQRLNSGEGGEISTIFSTSKESFNINYILTNNGTKILSDSIKDITAGETLFMLLIPGAVDITKNYVVLAVETPVEEVIEENETEGNSALSGGVVDHEEVDVEGEKKGFKFSNLFNFFRISGFLTAEGDKSSSVKFVYYGIGAVFVLAIAFFVFKRKKNSVGGKFRNDEDELGDAQRKIDEAEQEIREVRRRRVGI